MRTRPRARGRAVWGERGAPPLAAAAAVASAAAVTIALLAVGTAAAGPPGPEERFREGTALLRAGDIPGGLAIYRELAASGHESVNLYWNWAQGAAARGRAGEAIWALLRAREVGPRDAAAEREIDRLRRALRLEPGELDPVPTAALGRLAHRWHLGALAALLWLLSVAASLLARKRVALLWPKVATGVLAALGLAAVAVVAAGASARPTAVITARDVELLDAAAPAARPVATLREGEVVPVFDAAGEFLRIQDSSGARGWVRSAHVWRLDGPPPAEAR